MYYLILYSEKKTNKKPIFSNGILLPSIPTLYTTNPLYNTLIWAEPFKI